MSVSPVVSKKRAHSPLPLIGLGIVAMLLVSLPVIAVLTGAVQGSPQYVLMQEVPERGDGAYLRVNDGSRAGVVKLYPWNFRLNEFPADAPAFNPAHVSGLVVSQRGLDEPRKYNLFRYEDGTALALDSTFRSTKLTLTPLTPLTTGQYMLDMPKSGLSSDRQYLYFVLDERATVLPVK